MLKYCKYASFSFSRSVASPSRSVLIYSKSVLIYSRSLLLQQVSFDKAGLFCWSRSLLSLNQLRGTRFYYYCESKQEELDLTYTLSISSLDASVTRSLFMYTGLF